MRSLRDNSLARGGLGSLLWLLDAAIGLALLLIPIILLGRLRLTLGPARVSAHADWRPFVVPLLLAGARIAIARRTGVKGPWDRPAFIRLVLCSLDGLVVLLLLAAPLAWILDPLAVASGVVTFTVPWSWRLAAALAAAILLRSLVKRWRGRSRGWMEAPLFRKLSLSLVSGYVFVGLLEGILTLANFSADLPQVIFEGKNAKGMVEFRYYTPDPELGFRLEPGDLFSGRRVNILGFRDREVDPVKKAGAARVICMGDSVTAQGFPGYAEYLNESLSREPPTSNAWEAFIMAVHSYSSLQGLRLFQKRGAALKPDIVTLYFGWNDHWLMTGFDRQRMAVALRPLVGRMFEAMRHKRLFMFALWLHNPFQYQAGRETLDSRDADGPWRGRVLRVPPDEYRATLTRFVSEVRRSGAIPLLIAAPRRGLTADLIRQRFARSVPEAERLHDRYVDITREVARESGAELLDLAAILSGPECDPLFAPDGIHFDRYQDECLLGNTQPDPQVQRHIAAGVEQPGLRRIAAELDRKIREIVRGAAWATRAEGRAAGSRGLP